LYPNLYMASDPSLLDISGIKVALTSTDILMHLSKEEFCTSVGTDRLSRLASHLLKQNSFYPLYPGAEEMAMDFDLFSKYGKMDYLPHLLVLPSDLKYFVKDIKGCLTVNPGRNTKGHVGGSFARISVRRAADEEEWTPNSHIKMEILKI